MTDVPDLGPVPQRVRVDADQVRRMLAEQFPQWAGLRVEPVARGGWDNWTFHLGDDLLVRVPSAAEYALAVEKEQHWLPVLAPLLPVAVPVPVGHGAPGLSYGLPWSVYRWLPGRTASADRIADPVGFAEDLADVLLALQAVDTTDGPQPGIHNWFRGATLRTYDATARGALGELAGDLDTDLVLAVWTDALGRGWDGVDRWFHGDVAQGNVLLDDDGHLSALIDFGTCGVGDPSCDLAVAWTLLTSEGRAVFRDRLAVDDDTWARGRGWALWKALATCAAATGDERAEGLRIVEAIVSDRDA